MENGNQSVWRGGWRVWWRLIAAGVMSAIIYLSLYVLATGFMSVETGYRIITQEGDKTVIVSEYYYQDGERFDDLDVKVADGQAVSRIKEIGQAGKTALAIASSVLMLSLVAVFVYNCAWKIGTADEASVRVGKMPREPWRGCLIGAVATIPAAVLYLLLVLGRLGILPGWVFSLYRLLNVPFLPIINACVPATVTAAGEVSFGALLLLILPLLFVPAVCEIGYALGLKHYSFLDRMTYQEK